MSTSTYTLCNQCTTRITTIRTRLSATFPPSPLTYSLAIPTSAFALSERGQKTKAILDAIKALENPPRLATNLRFSNRQVAESAAEKLARLGCGNPRLGSVNQHSDEHIALLELQTAIVERMKELEVGWAEHRRQQKAFESMRIRPTWAGRAHLERLRREARREADVAEFHARRGMALARARESEAAQLESRREAERESRRREAVIRGRMDEAAERRSAQGRVHQAALSGAGGFLLREGLNEARRIGALDDREGGNWSTPMDFVFSDDEEDEEMPAWW
jgi:hypothetical protein